uniref:TerC family protein n=1 Tax=Schlesneria paludicola TaxID=360056 RepID=A0A7C4LJK0_9PLAN
MNELLTVENLVAFLALTSLETVLGIDNVIFIAILAGQLPERQRELARQLGLSIAVLSRIALLLGIGWVMQLTRPWFHLAGHEFTGKDVVLLLGGLFLLVQATREIHHKVAGHSGHGAAAAVSTLTAMLVQVGFMDVIFSLDSVITAVGMSKQIPVMIAAILASIAVMLIFSGAIVRFVDRHPAIKILALAFLLLIGVLLVAEGFHYEIPKGYIYFAMAFALGVELLQMRAERQAEGRVSTSLPHGD